MKVLLLGLIALASLNAFAHRGTQACSIVCSENGEPAVGAQISKVTGQLIFAGSRDYDTWSITCDVLNPKGQLRFRTTGSGAFVAGVGQQMLANDYTEDHPGKRLKLLRERKEVDLTRDLKQALTRFNQNP